MSCTSLITHAIKINTIAFRLPRHTLLSYQTCTDGPDNVHKTSRNTTPLPNTVFFHRKCILIKGYHMPNQTKLKWGFFPHSGIVLRVTCSVLLLLVTVELLYSISMPKTMAVHTLVLLIAILRFTNGGKMVLLRIDWTVTTYSFVGQKLWLLVRMGNLVTQAQVWINALQLQLL